MKSLLLALTTALILGSLIYLFFWWFLDELAEIAINLSGSF